MSLAEVWRPVRKRWGLLVALALAAAILAGAAVQRAGPLYRAHFSYLVALQEREAAGEFRFDGYYALQATDLFAATLAQWLATPELSARAYEAAGLPLPGPDGRELTRAIEARKAAPQLVTVAAAAESAAAAEALARGIVVAVAEQMQRYHEEGVPAARFKVVPSSVWVGSTPPDTWVAVLAVFLLVLFGGVTGLLLTAVLVQTKVA